MSRSAQNWKIEVMFLAGLSTRQVAREVLGDEGSVGRVHRIVRAKKLEAVRQSDGRGRALLTLDGAAPAGCHGIVGAVVSGLAKDAAQRLSKGERGAELVTRKLMPAEMQRLRGEPIEPPKIIPSIRPKSGLVYNDANCTLSWMGARGWLTEWAVQGGIAFRRDFHLIGGGVKALDYSKPKVDGSGPSGIRDNALDAATRRDRALGAVEYIFARDHLDSRLALLDHVAVQDLYLRQFQGMPKHLAARRAKTLLETLEPIAWSYGYHRDGEVAKRLERWASGRDAA